MLSVSGMHVDNLDVGMGSILKKYLWNRYCICLHSVCITDDTFQFQTWLKLTQCLLFSQNGIQSQSNKSAFHGALQINVVWLIGYLLKCVSVSVRMLNTHCADWQAAPALQIQICSAEAVQKVSQLPDWKD